MNIKKCIKCNKTKILDQFYKNKKSKDGLNYKCKECAGKEKKEWNKKHKEHIKKYNKKWNEKNPDKVDLYFQKNKQKFYDYRNQWIKEKYKNDLNFKISTIMSTGIRQSLKGKKQGRCWENLVNYNVYDLIKHIEFQFTQGMSWLNYGEWEIDHIKAKSEFNITDFDCADFKICWALSNLQPLWKTTRTINGITYLGNRNKSNKEMI